MLTEPKRCLKCQKYRHYISDCKAMEDTCARCGDPHWTALCTTDIATGYQCINCMGNEAIGHSTADRECTAYKVQCRKIHERTPKNKYKFFPTSAPFTWRLLNAPEPLPDKPQTTQHHDGRTHMEVPNQQHQQHFMEDWQTV
jgi:hypothetical protein